MILWRMDIFSTVILTNQAKGRDDHLDITEERCDSMGG